MTCHWVLGYIRKKDPGFFLFTCGEASRSRSSKNPHFGGGVWTIPSSPKLGNHQNVCRAILTIKVIIVEVLDLDSDQCDQLWPGVTNVTRLQIAIINIKAIIVEVPDLDSDQCDQLWPGVTSCDQGDQIKQSNNNHQGHQYWGPWCQQKLLWPPVTRCDQVWPMWPDYKEK